MPGALVTVMTALIILYALLVRRLTAWNLTSPMLSLVAGLVAFSFADFIEIEATEVHLIAEVTLVLILFHDASTVQISRLRADSGIPIRLLAIGFPLAMVMTWGVTAWTLPAMGAAGALLVAASITPTDAGLGAPTVLNPKVPIRVRRGLNVESGLNDGLATPIVLIALGILAAEEGVEPPTLWQVGAVPVALALVIAVVAGLLIAYSVDRSRAAHWGSSLGRTVIMLATPLFMLGLADLLGANGFITAFVGGLVFGAACTTLAQESEMSSLLEVTSDLLSFVVWFLAGGLLLIVFDAGLKWQWLFVSVAALTVLRIVPVFLSLIGTGFTWQTVGFIGWFGPRGLASIVFALLAVEELGSDGSVIADVTGIVAVTVVLSVFGHGMTAGPLSVKYGQWVSRNHAPIEREPSVEPSRTRGSSQMFGSAGSRR